MPDLMVVTCMYLAAREPVYSGRRVVNVPRQESATQPPWKDGRLA